MRRLGRQGFLFQFGDGAKRLDAKSGIARRLICGLRMGRHTALNHQRHGGQQKQAWLDCSSSFRVLAPKSFHAAPSYADSESAIILSPGAQISCKKLPQPRSSNEGKLSPDESLGPRRPKGAVWRWAGRGRLQALR